MLNFPRATLAAAWGSWTASGGRPRALLRPLWRARLASARVKLTLEKTTEGSMRLPHRRQFLHLIAGTAAVPTVSGFARAQAYPSRPVHIMVGFAAGGGVDIVARLVGRLLSARLGQPFVVENRVGAGSNIAAETVMRAPSDGYTLLLAHTTNTINATLYEKLNFDFKRDIAPVASIARGFMI